MTERDGKPVALAGLAADAWHSEVYGMRMGKLQPWLNTISIAAGAEMLAVIEEAALRAGHEHLSVRIDGEDFANLHLFESAGWRLIDVSLKFSRPMPQASAIPSSPESEFHFVDLAQPGDAQWIRCIGSQTHGGTHFLNDPALPPIKRASYLPAGWTAASTDWPIVFMSCAASAIAKGPGSASSPTCATRPSRARWGARR